MIEDATRIINNEKEVREYYENWFNAYGDRVLFELYDIEKEEYIKFPGREGSYVMSKTSLINGIVGMETSYIPVDDLVVVLHTNQRTDFTDPVFVGKTDGFLRKT